MRKASALVVGGGGALGRAFVDAFKTSGFVVASVDRIRNDTADLHVDAGVGAAPALRDALDNAAPFDAVVCAAGAWAGGSVAADDAADSAQHLFDACVRPSFLAAHFAARMLAAAGDSAHSSIGDRLSPLFVLTGAAAALSPTPGMAAYGAAKAAVHHLATSAAAGGLPAGCRVVLLLPTTLDTPSNRRWMAGPGVDTSAWTPPNDVAARVVAWAHGGDADVVRPNTCTFVEPITTGGATRYLAYRDGASRAAAVQLL